jgi:hypothetical protein
MKRLPRKKVVKKRPAGKKRVNSTKVVVDGITFQSILESKMYLLLKGAGIKSSYEGKSYQTFDSLKLKAPSFERSTRKSKEMKDKRDVRGVSYTPDFIGENEEWFIEVKGRPNESFSIRWKLFKAYVTSWRKPPIIFKPQSIKDCEQVVSILTSLGYGSKPN